MSMYLGRPPHTPHPSNLTCCSREKCLSTFVRASPSHANPRHAWAHGNPSRCVWSFPRATKKEHRPTVSTTRAMIDATRIFCRKGRAGVPKPLADQSVAGDGPGDAELERNWVELAPKSSNDLSNTPEANMGRARCTFRRCMVRVLRTVVYDWYWTCTSIASLQQQHSNRTLSCARTVSK